jgi:hypothetical protein
LFTPRKAAAALDLPYAPSGVIVPPNRENGMEIEKHRIHGTQGPVTRGLFDEHMELMAKHPYREFRTEEIAPAVGYAAQYFVDAVQDLLYAAMRPGSEKPIDIELASGWRVKTLDLGLHWKRHLEFSNSTDPDVGFIVQGKLECHEKRPPSDKTTTKADVAGMILAMLRSTDDPVKDNRVSDTIDPANSERFNEITVYPFNLTEGGYNQRERIVDALQNSSYARSIVDIRPHRKVDARSLPPELRSEYSMIMVSDTGRATGPKGTLETLPIISEYLATVDGHALQAAYEDHADTVHFTLQKELWFLLAAARNRLGQASASASFPPAPFVDMIDELWKRGASEDIAHFLTEIAEAASELIKLGHVNADETFDCNDGRTRVYAFQTDEGYKAFVDGDDFGVCVSVQNDRVVMSTGSYELGTEDHIILDVTIDEGVVIEINKVAAFDDASSGILRLTMVEFSSAHCHLVTEPRQRKTSAPKPR